MCSAVDPDLIYSVTAQEKLPFSLGMVICLLSGALSPMLNLGLAFGNDGKDGMQERATFYHVGQTYNNNATWCVGVGAGFTVNFSYCVYKLCVNQTWGNFLPSCCKNSSPNPSIQDAGWHDYALSPWYHASPGGAMNWIYCMIMCVDPAPPRMLLARPSAHSPPSSHLLFS